MREQKVISVEEVRIQSATVEIKILTVAGKQMTLAVFRQLPEEPLVDYGHVKLLGKPWGRVNYHVGCEGYDDLDHIHVVWQEDKELRRSVVQSHREYSAAADTLKAHMVVLERRALFHAIEETLITGEPPELVWIGNSRVGNVSVGGIQISYDCPGHLFNRRANGELVIDGLAEMLRNYKLSLGTTDTMMEHLLMLVSQRRSLALKLQEEDTQWWKLYTDLSELPQLFIAV